MLIYHITHKETWEAALQSGVYAPPQLQEEGFLHFSTKDQLIESAAKHFKGQNNLLILIVSEKHVKSKLKYEPGRNDELFPHVYGKLPVESVQDTRLLVLDETGAYELV